MGGSHFLVVLAQGSGANPSATVGSRIAFSLLISAAPRLGTCEFSVAAFPNLPANYEQFSANFAAAQFWDSAERITLASRFTRDCTLSGTILRNLVGRSQSHEKIRSTARVVG